MKLADVTPVFKEKDPFKKKTIDLVYLLFQKIFEKFMQTQILGYLENFLSSYVSGYRENFNTQQASLTLIENWKKSVITKVFVNGLIRSIRCDY